ncbi:YceI family protein [Desertivirga xinjiangensis]|uniref:YceI family protein n=1 Tax=Desertivirga xinjiangensis TaxID=539206 RepID=UPI00210A52CB|nr:YceI family protein [Pedobacter xinjiangensis]
MQKSIIFSLIAILFFASCENDDDKKTLVNYEISAADSHVEWWGYLREGNNHGTFSLNNDEIKTENGKVTGGAFSIPISSVNVINLEGDLKEQLEHHLLSADFFNVALHPNVTFNIKLVTPFTEAEKEGIIAGANYTVTGDLQLLGTTKEISFPAKITVKNDNLDAEALIRINRLHWGMTYASDPNEGMYILPDVDLQLKLSAKKK